MSRSDFVGSGLSMFVGGLIVDEKTGALMESNPPAFCMPGGTKIDASNLRSIKDVTWKPARCAHIDMLADLRRNGAPRYLREAVRRIKSDHHVVFTKPDRPMIYGANEREYIQAVNVRMRRFVAERLDRVMASERDGWFPWRWRT